MKRNKFDISNFERGGAAVKGESKALDKPEVIAPADDEDREFVRADSKRVKITTQWEKQQDVHGEAWSEREAKERAATRTIPQFTELERRWNYDARADHVEKNLEGDGVATHAVVAMLPGRNAAERATEHKAARITNRRESQASALAELKRKHQLKHV